MTHYTNHKPYPWGNPKKEIPAVVKFYQDNRHFDFYRNGKRVEKFIVWDLFKEDLVGLIKIYNCENKEFKRKIKDNGRT